MYAHTPKALGAGIALTLFLAVTQEGWITTARGSGNSLSPVEGGAVADFGEGFIQHLKNDAIAGRVDAAEVARAALERPANPRQSDDPPQDWIATAESDVIYDVLVKCKEDWYDWSRIRGAADDSSREIAVLDRKIAASAAVTPVVATLQRLGARDIEAFWVSAEISAKLPGKGLRDLAADPNVERIRRNSTTGSPLLAYDGDIVETGMRTRLFLSTHQGDSGGRSGGAIRLGVFEWFNNSDGTSNLPARGHNGFSVLGATRIVKQYNCLNTPCSLETSSDDDAVPSHATAVMRVAGGSVEAGQDSDVPFTADRRMRSGVASGVRYYVYRLASGSSLQRAIDQAVSDGIDIANHSYDLSCAPPTSQCGTQCDQANGHLKSSTSAGILHVAAAGNSGHSGGIGGTCNAGYPSLRRETISVAALDTSSSSFPYDTSALASYSSLGGMNMTTTDGSSHARAFAIVDVAAPGDHSYSYRDSALVGDGNALTGYDTSTQSGTSFATPAVSGAAALLKDAMFDIGWGGLSARALQINVLLMADGYSFFNGFKTQSGFDSVSGAGRIHMHWPSSVNLVSPWGWGWRTVTLHSGETLAFTVGGGGPVSPSVSQWKAAMTWEEDDYLHVADIVLSVYNTCPSGGGAPQLIRRDLSWDIRKRLTLYANEMSPGGVSRCLEYRAEAWNIPPGETRTVHLADYFHSGSPNDH